MRSYRTVASQRKAVAAPPFTRPANIRKLLNSLHTVLKTGSPTISSGKTIEVILDDLEHQVTGSEWKSSSDDFVDHAFLQLAQDIPQVDPSFPLHQLVKPSTPPAAALQMIWNYATRTARKPYFGSTYDESNPCLKLIIEKLGLERENSGNKVFMTEAIPSRYIRINKNDIFLYIRTGGLILDHFQDSSSTMPRYCTCPIAALHGEQNFLRFQQSVQYKFTVRIVLWRESRYLSRTRMHSWYAVDRETRSMSCYTILRVSFI
ncbi:hypothetical protein BDZ45DRAFT_477314 [Acephala macrosclerotiorum]|nr:hypothetical protein BDZ45DRAFT_477314 [Acephala macrosclerotiorum]